MSATITATVTNEVPLDDWRRRDTKMFSSWVWLIVLSPYLRGQITPQPQKAWIEIIKPNRKKINFDIA